MVKTPGWSLYQMEGIRPSGCVIVLRRTIAHGNSIAVANTHWRQIGDYWRHENEMKPTADTIRRSYPCG